MTGEERLGAVKRTVEFIETGRNGKGVPPFICEDLGADLVCMDFGAELITYDNRDVDEYHVITDPDEIESLRVLDGERHVVKVRYPVTDSARNGMGNMQGGMMASLIDNAFAIVVVPLYGPFLTINLDINYFAPVTREFDSLEVEAEIIKQGNTTKYLEARVYRGDGKLAALAGTNIMMVKKK